MEIIDRKGIVLNTDSRFDIDDELEIEVRSSFSNINVYLSRSQITQLLDHLNKVLGEKEDVKEVMQQKKCTN